MGIFNSATISPDGVYRYDLVRMWDTTRPRVCWIMLNPSKADGTHDDRTIRKCLRFSQIWEFGSLVVANLFALRSTDPAGLWRVDDPRGPDNLEAMDRATSSAGVVIAAWGAHPKAVAVSINTAARLRSRGVLLHHLGLTKDGHPKHPLYLPFSVRPTPWP
jgi:hypothetical protein